MGHVVGEAMRTKSMEYLDICGRAYSQALGGTRYTDSTARMLRERVTEHSAKNSADCGRNIKDRVILL